MLDEEQKNTEDKYCVHCGTLTDPKFGQCKNCASKDFKGKNPLKGNEDAWMYYGFFGAMALICVFTGFSGFFICGLEIAICNNFEPKRLLLYMFVASIIAITLLYNCFTILKYGREHKVLKYLSLVVIAFIYWFFG